MESEVDDIHTLKSKISEIQNNIKSNPYNYDGHVEYITLLSRVYYSYNCKELTFSDESEEKRVVSEQMLISFKKLRHARQSMETVYPLSIELWTKWIEDEVNAPSSLINYDVIDEIFSKATVDYLSVDIWCLYANYLIGRLQDGKSTIDVICETFEKAVTNCGLHYWDGHKIWKCYQDFELMLLTKAEKLVREDKNAANLGQMKNHLVKLVKLYKRQMSLALAKQDELLDEFKNRVVPYVDSLNSFSNETEPLFNIDEIEKLHQKTSEDMKSITTKENNLVEEQHVLEAYQSYIGNELDTGLNNPAIIQCLFERAIVYHCLKPNLWLDYIDFLDNILKLPDLLIKVCKRALRNVSWDYRIDIKYALILEKLAFNNDEIRTVYEDALQKYTNNAQYYCTLVIYYLSFVKRINEELSIAKTKQRIYHIIQQAIHQFTQIPDAENGIGDFVMFWVDAERFWFNNEEKAKDIWKYMLSKYKTLLPQAIVFARTLGNAELVNDFFNILLLRFPDDVEIFSQSILNCQNVLGTVDSLNHVTRIVNLYLPSRLQARKTKESQQLLSKLEHKQKFIKSWLRNAEEALFAVNKPERLDHDSTAKKNKRPHENEANHKHTGIKKIYLDIDDNNEKKSIHKNDINTSTNNASIIGPVLPPGFLPNDSDTTDSDDTEDEDAPPTKKQKIIDEAPNEVSIPKTESLQQCSTVFVSNLHPATKETDLRTIFSRAGNVEKVDLRKQKTGKIFAYVTYSTPEEAQKAFELEHTPLLNRPLFVSEFKYSRNSDRSSTNDNLSNKYSQHQERNKLFVSNLHKATTQNDLEKLFNQYGDMVSVRLINKKGSAKSFAYVEYGTVEAASRYLKAINKTIVKGLAINVDFSDPSISNRSDKQKSFNPEVNNQRFVPNDRNKRVVGAMDEDKESSSRDTFIKPKPVKLGLIPFQAQRKQPTHDTESTKKGPAVRINFVPSSVNTTETTSNETDGLESANNAQSSEAAVSSARKSNEEFRKMFFKS